MIGKTFGHFRRDSLTETDGEDGPAALRVSNLDLAVVQQNNGLDDGQAQSMSAPALGDAEEGFEHRLHEGLIHARPVVPDGQSPFIVQ